MCAILDANVRDQVFGEKDRPEAGKEFFRWINGEKQGKGLRLVVGGKLTRELIKNDRRTLDWLAAASSRGRILEVSKDDIARGEEEIKDVSLKSNDRHVIVLARVGRARLLYSNDMKLHADFTSMKLVSGPRGKVYSTLKNKQLDDAKRSLLREAQCNRCSS